MKKMKHKIGTLYVNFENKFFLQVPGTKIVIDLKELDKSLSVHLIQVLVRVLKDMDKDRKKK